jgi:hypothetical protein
MLANPKESKPRNMHIDAGILLQMNPIYINTSLRKSFFPCLEFVARTLTATVSPVAICAL